MCGFTAFRGQKFVEGGVEHADDFGGFVVNYRFALFVPQDGNGEAAGVGRISLEVELAVESETVEGIFGVCAAKTGIDPGWRPWFGGQYDNNYKYTEGSGKGG